jgi:hypothetical protein
MISTLTLALSRQRERGCILFQLHDKDGVISDRGKERALVILSITVSQRVLYYDSSKTEQRP